MSKSAKITVADEITQFALEKGEFRISEAYNEEGETEGIVTVSFDFTPDGERDYIVFRIGEKWVFSVSIKDLDLLVAMQGLRIECKDIRD